MKLSQLKLSIVVTPGRGRYLGDTHSAFQQGYRERDNLRVRLSGGAKVRVRGGDEDEDGLRAGVALFALVILE